jgi:hypothetical protein
MTHRGDAVKRLVFLTVFLLSCESHTFFERLSSEYAPYENIGNRWEFVVTEEDTAIVEWLITERTSRGGMNAVAIEGGANTMYFAREEDGLYEWMVTTRNFSDQVVVLEERWRRRIELPFATGNRWVDHFENEVQVTGLTYRIDTRLEGSVAAVEPVFTQADYFDSAYPVDIVIVTTINDPLLGETREESHLREWYAPDIGLVRREVRGAEEWVLRDYSVIP